jgi:uncharacterized lipoprotein YehR (DUF1307 family)
MIERRKINIAAWVAVGLTAFIAVASTISAFSVTQYKVDSFARQSAIDRSELKEFRLTYTEEQRKTYEDVSAIKQSVARIEESLKNLRENK